MVAQPLAEEDVREDIVEAGAFRWYEHAEVYGIFQFDSANISQDSTISSMRMSDVEISLILFLFNGLPTPAATTDDVSLLHLVLYEALALFFAEEQGLTTAVTERVIDIDFGHR